MTRKQIQQQITAFTGDWKSAREKAKIFDDNCCVPLTQVVSIKLSFGKRTDADGSVHEDRDALYFRYLTKSGEGYVFSILR